MAADHFCLKWNNFHNSIVTVFESLQSSEELVDVTLMCEGQNVKAHKVILSACSPYFRNLFKEIPCQHPVIILKDVLHSDLVAILQFMYQGEVLITQDGLASFLKTAELLQVSGLAGNPATTRTTAIDTNLPTEINVPLRIPSPVIPLSPTSPAKSTTTIKNHASPVTESISKEIENIDTEQSVLSQFEAAIEPIQSCSYEPQEQMVIKTEADEVEFSEMDYTSMSHDHTNDSGPPTEEQSILERSLKAHGFDVELRDNQTGEMLLKPQCQNNEQIENKHSRQSKLKCYNPISLSNTVSNPIKRKYSVNLASDPDIEQYTYPSRRAVHCPYCAKFIKEKRNLNSHYRYCSVRRIMPETEILS